MAEASAEAVPAAEKKAAGEGKEIEEISKSLAKKDVSEEEEDKPAPVGVRLEGHLTSDTKFEDFITKEDLLRGIRQKGWSTPSQIQALSLPIILGTKEAKKKNLIAQAKTGSGKTGAFALGILQTVDARSAAPQALVVCHTRELAIQSASEIRKLSEFMEGLKIAECVNTDGRKVAISGQVVVGTPGTLLKSLTPPLCAKMKMVIFDEADMMFEEGNFKDSSIKIVKMLRSPQVLLFSATYTEKVTNFCERYIHNPETIRISEDKLSIDTIWHVTVDVKTPKNRLDCLRDLLQDVALGSTIIFANRKDTVKEVAEEMRERGVAVSVFHGGMTPEERTKAYNLFIENKTTMLVATDVLSRGIDNPTVNMVVNYDMPNVKYDAVRTYLHRTGRTGRFGHGGVAINFLYGSQSQEILESVEQKYKIEFVSVDKDNLEEIGKFLKKPKNA